MDRMTVISTAAVLAFCAAVGLWLRHDHLAKVAEVEACEALGGVAVIAARARYACLTAGVLRAP